MRLWPRSPSLALLALALSVALWYGRALERRMPVAEREVEASLTLVNVPPRLVVVSSVPRGVVVRLRGPLERLRGAERLEAVVDLRHAQEGEALYPVDRRLVGLPSRVEVVTITPGELSLRLEEVISRHLPVRASLVGTPAPGWVLREARVEPRTVRVQGPRQQVEALPELVTEAVLLEGARQSFAVTVGVRLPSPLLRLVEPSAVTVFVGLEPSPPHPPAGGSL
jgi:YbbR domain-containing protein